MYTLMWICLGISTVISLVWLFLFFKFKNQYTGLLDGVDEKIFALSKIYFIGLGAIELYEQATRKKITDNEKAIEKMKELSEIFGRDNAELYYYILFLSLIHI